MSQHDGFLSLKNLQKQFGDVKAVNNISVDIDKGELISFIGPSGCGKTTLLRIIGGFQEHDSGSITLDNEKIDHLSPENRSTGMVFQNYALFPHMTVYQNIEYGLKIQKLQKSERKKRIEEVLSQVQLEGYGDRKPSELSGGQQQRVAIARCLVLHPKVLLLDEPLSNLDAKLRMTMREEIRRLKEELDLTIIFVTHDQEEALSISDRMIVLNDGNIQQLDKPDLVYTKPQNEFVANFVGQANIITGSVNTSDGSTYFHAGEITFNVQDADPSEDAMAVIRPEQIALNTDGPIRGEITKIVYNGSFTRYFVKIDEFEVMVDTVNTAYSLRYQKGDRVGIEFPDTPHFIKKSKKEPEKLSV
ncbi:putative spermidine/putrescine transport system ATP-binding protein [Lentibacillus halodurans]|uniref:Carnitine transport ATP-binding protein OpuCA n=1 Tax=Lentibacillus halodurans TaxID=237679 RepID=A0A1I0Y5T9_9BACI|nr:ABC transporter ATP-binding protein [Lentibacillus halodurans]SFB08755.1 putative spermidine/putrescine transport system ATP-binding protein [Lentibacillus halodurans]